MRRTGKLLLFLLASLFFLTAGLLLLLLYRGRRIRAFATYIWARTMSAILGVRVETAIATSIPSGSLLVANHQSYLDIIILSSVVPTLFVAKRDVGSWPLLGWLARLGGTVFVDRNALRGGTTTALRAAEVLSEQVNILCFPEGTSTNGSTVLPFRPTIFTAASPGTAIVPVIVNYRTIDGEPVTAHQRDRILWYGEMRFIGHFWELLRCRSVTADVIVGAPLIVPSIVDPRGLASECRSSVLESFTPIA